jgi:protein-S-isoprenylcysteine O-methyltransferase Ste14
MIAAFSFGLVTVAEVVRQYRTRDNLTSLASTCVYIAYVLQILAVLLAAWFNVWQVPLNPVMAFVIGLLLIIVGLACFMAAFVAFRSLDRASGRRHDRLIVSGIYRFSRNPQNVGCGLALIGAAVIGRSALAALIVLVLTVIFHVYVVRIEEPYLLRVFGRRYAAYRARSPRYFGCPRLSIPRNMRERADAEDWIDRQLRSKNSCSS